MKPSKKFATPFCAFFAQLRKKNGNRQITVFMTFLAFSLIPAFNGNASPFFGKTCCACYNKSFILTGQPEIANVQAATQGCTLSFSSTSKPIILTDCDGSGAEAGAWKAPAVKATDGCGPISLVQTAGPTPGVEIPLSKYDVTYTAMAVDKKSGEIVSIKQTFSIENQQDKIAPTMKDMPAQALKKGAKIPDFSKTTEITDNCTPTAKLRFVQQPAAGTPFDGITKLIKLSATDAAGNQASFEIKVK